MHRAETEKALAHQEAIIANERRQPYRFAFNSAVLREAETRAARLRSWLTPPELADIPDPQLAEAIGMLRRVFGCTHDNTPLKRWLKGDAAAQALARHAPGDEPADQIGRNMRLLFPPSRGYGRDVVRWAIRYGESLLIERNKQRNNT